VGHLRALKELRNALEAHAVVAPLQDCIVRRRKDRQTRSVHSITPFVDINRGMRKAKSGPAITRHA
jgi:hypothetical protein